MRFFTSQVACALHSAFFCFVLFTLFGAQSASAQQFHVVNGTWITQQQSEITIEPCEQGLCGFISHIVVPPEIIEKYGADVLAQFEGAYPDANNEDPALRDRSVLGLTILVLTEQVTATRYSGKVYNPQDGKTYDGFVDVVDGNNIVMSGCIAWGTICQGESWVRAPEVIEMEDDAKDEGAAQS